MEGNYYTLSIPTTILDIMASTKSFGQQAQQDLANRFAAQYEHAQSLLRPVNATIRFFSVDPGGGQWVLDNGWNLRVCHYFLQFLLVVQVQSERRSGTSGRLCQGSSRS